MLRKLFIIPVLTFVFTLSYSQSMKIMTYNIKYHGSWVKENVWDDRKETMVEQILHYSPEVLGVQEAVKSQMKYLSKNLPNYSYIGIGRDGKKKGEFSAVFYDTTKLTVLRQSTFWLSAKPDEISKGWDAALNRICTYGLFQVKNTKKLFWIFNTHFDHVGKEARTNSGKLILEKINKLNSGNYPVVLTGDLNALPDSPPISVLNSELNDAYKVSAKAPYGPKGTFNGYNAEKIPETRIDYIFVKELNVKSLTHIDDRLDDYNFISDHFPVMVEIEF